jgi:hypothetical protein
VRSGILLPATRPCRLSRTIRTAARAIFAHHFLAVSAIGMRIERAGNSAPIGFAKRLLDTPIEKIRIVFERTNRKPVGLSSATLSAVIDEMLGEVLFQVVFAPDTPPLAILEQMQYDVNGLPKRHNKEIWLRIR